MITAITENPVITLPQPLLFSASVVVSVFLVSEPVVASALSLPATVVASSAAVVVLPASVVVSALVSSWVSSGSTARPFT